MVIQRMSDTSLQQWLDRLEQLHPAEIELGLDRIRQVAHALNLLPLSQPVITVAGTNGKGSTVAVLEALFEQCGQRCGSFTSPHFLRFNERIRIDGEEASDAQIIQAFETIDAARGEISLTYFEFAALAALQVFAWEAPDVVVLEVGLGGRLDAVNIVDATVAVITSIALDHQGWLGNTRDEIAVEKAGILRADRPAVVADESPPQSLQDTIASVGAQPALFFGDAFGVAPTGSGYRQLTLWQPGGEAKSVTLPPGGGLLVQNIAAALQAALVLGMDFTEDDVRVALSTVSLNGRRQSVNVEGIRYVLDVAHNPAAVGALLEYLQSSCSNGRKIAVFSVMGDKDYASMLELAAGTFDAWLLADQPDNSRSAGAADLARVLDELQVERVSHNKNLRQALARARQLAAPGDCVVVFGSFTTVAAALGVVASSDSLQEAG